MRCAYCEADFEARTCRRRFCSDKCRHAAWQANREHALPQVQAIPRAEDQKVELSTGLGTIMAVLEPLLSETPVTVSMHGVFFAGEYFEPLRLPPHLIAHASQSIGVIDG